MTYIRKREKALKNCFDLWMWLALNPDDRKSDWPGWIKNGGHVERCTSHCPACSYCRSDCDNCPITWTRADIRDPYCLQHDSPYQKWMQSGPHQKRIKYALEICALALEAI